MKFGTTTTLNVHVLPVIDLDLPVRVQFVSVCSDSSSPVQIIPNVSHLSVELGLTYTLACRTTYGDARWFFENGTMIPLQNFSSEAT